MAAAPTQVLVVGIFENELRAEQAARALEVWRRANRRLGLGPIGVVAHRLSGTTTWRTRGVLRPRRAALVGLLIGLALLALPAAGAAALAGWFVGSVVFGLAGLVGATPTGQAGGMVVALTVGVALLAALIAGAVGAVLGCLTGLVVALIDAEARGLSRTEILGTAAGLSQGEWAAIARVQTAAAPLVRDELARVGGAPAGLAGQVLGQPPVSLGARQPGPPPVHDVASGDPARVPSEVERR